MTGKVMLGTIRNKVTFISDGKTYQIENTYLVDYLYCENGTALAVEMSDSDKCWLIPVDNLMLRKECDAVRADSQLMQEFLVRDINYIARVAVGITKSGELVQLSGVRKPGETITAILDTTKSVLWLVESDNFTEPLYAMASSSAHVEIMLEALFDFEHPNWTIQRVPKGVKIELSLVHCPLTVEDLKSDKGDYHPEGSS